MADSPAATVAISAPKKEKTTTSIAAKTGPVPWGKKPPWPVRFVRPGAEKPGSRPAIASTPSTRNTVIAATLMPANQNSNSPKDRTEYRFVSVSRTVSTRAHVHCGTPGTQRCTMAAPAVASMPTTTTQNHQYSQPIAKPAHGPIARSA